MMTVDKRLHLNRLHKVEPWRMEMNYMSNAISETLNYDTTIDANGQTVLTKCLNDIFDLKQPSWWHRLLLQPTRSY